MLSIKPDSKNIQAKNLEINKTMPNQTMPNHKLRPKLPASNFHLTNNKIYGFYLLVMCIFGFISEAHADWFQVGNIQQHLIAPIYTLVNENLGYVAFSVGGASTFLARGQDMYQKGIAFAIGSLGTAASVKLAQTVMHLG